MVRHAFLHAAGSAVELLEEPAISASWDAPSVLPEFSVKGLAGHLARQIFHVHRLLSHDPPDEQPITVLEHYLQSNWVGKDPDDDVNIGIRRDAEKVAVDGPEALADQTRATVELLRDELPAQPADRVVYVPWGPWSLTLDDFLITRMLEIAVHCDDLALSVDVDTPALHPRVVDEVVVLLTRLAVRRHGAIPVLRALSRAERAPATIAAI